jgi:hypothetical protein
MSRPDIANMFAELDENNDGFVSREELRRGLAERGVELSDVEFAQILAAADVRPPRSSPRPSATMWAVPLPAPGMRHRHASSLQSGPRGDPARRRAGRRRWADRVGGVRAGEPYR